MATYTLDQYQKKWRVMAAQLKKAGAKSTQAAAMFMRNTARGMAPMKSGDLRNGINAVPKENQIWEVSSSVPKGFPYHLWVNGSAPYNIIHPWWAHGNGVRYGDGSHINTGSYRYWSNALGQTTKVFGNISRQNVRNVLRGRII